ncbi:LysR family transcriptional regulator [Massilia yuzhufengensis]|uniref:Transcriptional regulator, LysR family n=1 Tax=Massilia yuzhufengensis TaxID=1164594 RepID=A0A1I1TSJ6_9BURK|nr:LysR family transcriptional regulator [Massilia yuzhufengensis]SFD61666.1 transcriptional regulator, LysR family [Massilia yuzhufengensis]
MDLDAIAVYVKVVEARSFSGAARLLNMPKTTVSAKVAALEKRLGVTLLHRTTRSLHVTDAGERYYRHCAKAVQEIELGEAALVSARDQPGGLLRVTAPVDIGHTLLPRITRAYLEAYPGTSVEMVVTNRMVDLVAEGIDLAVRVGVLKDSSMVARRFFDLSLQLWAAPSYLETAGTPRHPKDLARHRYVGYTSMQPVVLARGKVELEAPVRARAMADDFEAIKAMLVLGEGIGLLPDFLAAEAAASGALAPVLAAWKRKASGGFSFLYPGRKYASPNTQAYIATALALVKEGMAPDVTIREFASRPPVA